MDPFSPRFLLLSHSAFSPLLTTLAALSSSSHSGRVGISSPSSAKAWRYPSQDFLTISGKTKGICPPCTQSCAVAWRSAPASLLPLLLLLKVQVHEHPSDPGVNSELLKTHEIVHTFTHISCIQCKWESLGFAFKSLYPEVLVCGTPSRGNVLE